MLKVHSLLAPICAALAFAMLLAACSSGDGGDSPEATDAAVTADAGLKV
jgi:hypothetical protein